VALPLSSKPDSSLSPLLDTIQDFLLMLSMKTHLPKGQLISKCPFGVIVWTKIPTKFFPRFLP
jgi:hypothetical protein